MWNLPNFTLFHKTARKAVGPEKLPLNIPDKCDLDLSVGSEKHFLFFFFLVLVEILAPFIFLNGSYHRDVIFFFFFDEGILPFEREMSLQKLTTQR